MFLLFWYFKQVTHIYVYMQIHIDKVYMMIIKMPIISRHLKTIHSLHFGSAVFAFAANQNNRIQPLQNYVESTST
jgi:hypothetical protein